TADDLKAHCEPLYALAHNPEIYFIAHNVGFEKDIWRSLMVPWGWPDIPNDRWHDILAACAMKGLPLKLERAALAMHLANQKDTDGTKATLALSRTNKHGYYDRSPEKLQRVYDYCAQDVKTEVDLHKAVRGLGDAERKVWLLDQEINERGVCLDMDFVVAAQKVCDDAKAPLLKEFRAITGVNPTQTDKFKGWLADNGVRVPDLKKETVLKLIGEKDDDEEDTLADTPEDYEEDRDQPALPPACKRALRIRTILGSASIKKLAAMQACCGYDGRARRLLQYHGAGPGRWAGRLLQPQNFPRPTLKIVTGWKEDGSEEYGGHDAEELVETVKSGDHEFVRLLFGEPIEAVASGLRHAIIATPGNELVVGDFSKIECVIVLALAGQPETAADVLKKGSAVYTDMAAKVFKRPVSKKELKEYTIGKNIVLGCGFQMGAKKFYARYANGLPMSVAEEAVAAYREDFAPMVPKMWYGLERAATKCVWDGTPQEAYGIVYRLEDGWLTARLPSGRRLWYREPNRERKAMPWDPDDVRPGFTYRAWKTGQWKTIHAYGGLLTENVVQATARDLLVAAAMKCGQNGLPLVLTVHDELVADAEPRADNVKILEQIMTDRPEWAIAAQIPVGAECFSDVRYRK
ncbi:MAG TPA: hypothetical protein VG897_08665, partial [Terriglobales bacterium]|nr:hypothetical protein [Terriglobales bacterium]